MASWIIHLRVADDFVEYAVLEIKEDLIKKGIIYNPI